MHKMHKCGKIEKDFKGEASIMANKEMESVFFIHSCLNV